MSADNGVYILETNTKEHNRKEYRVRHLQAVENVGWDDNKQEPDKNYCGGYTDDPDITIKNARKMWSGCQVFYSEENALKEAWKMLKDLDVCEYGICRIQIDRIF